MKGLKRSYQELELEIAKLKSELEQYSKNSSMIENSENELFRERVFENSPIPIVVMDAVSYKYIDCNQAAVKIYQYSSKMETLGKTPFDVSAEFQYDGKPSSEKAIYYINKAIVEGCIVFKWLHQRPNGEFWDAEVQLICFKNGEENLLQFTLIDITEQKKAKEELILSEERLQSFMNSASDGFYLLDENLNFIEINNTALKVVKKNKADVIGKNIAEIVPDVKESGRYEKHLEVLKTGIPYIVEDFIPHPIFGDKHFIIKSFKVGKGLGVIAYDYTEQKQAEITARLTISQLKATLENTPNVAIQWYDISGKVLYWNKSSESLYGWTAQESIGKTLSELIHTPEEEQDFLKILHEIEYSQKPYGPFESHIHKKDGTTGWVLATTFPIPLDSNQTGFVCMDVDITQRKLSENELLIFKESLDNSTDAIGMATPDGLHYYQNKVFTALFGEIGQEPTEIYYDKNIGSEVFKILKTGGKWEGEVKMFSKDHHILDIYLKAYPNIDSSGQIISLVGIGFQINI
jgi:PAS domain S-box-containing protein